MGDMMMTMPPDVVVVCGQAVSLVLLLVLLARVLVVWAAAIAAITVSL
jgi:hypothetical protein